MIKDINSKEYWEDRFHSGSWKNNDGKKQSEFFYKIAIELMPKWLKDEIKKNKYSICDLGCAEGDGTYLLYKEFFNSDLSGADFSQQAIKIANERYNGINFYVEDLNSFDSRYDILFSSNTLEHFRNPFDIVEKLISKANKYIILLLPLNEKSRIAEHLSSFSTDLIPLNINNSKLVYYDKIDCTNIAGTQWSGEQILLVYSNESFKAKYDYTLDNLINNTFNNNITNELNNKSYELKNIKEENKSLGKQVIEIKEENKSLQKQIRELNNNIKELNELLHNLNTTKEELNSKLWSIYSSTFWKVALKYYWVRDNTFLGYPFRILKNIKHRNNTENKSSVSYENSELQNFNNNIDNKRMIDLLLANKSYPIVFAPLVDWNIPLFQRPQHIALNLASLGNTYFYCTTNIYDNIDGVDSIEGLENIYITNQYEYIMSLPIPKVFHMYAQDFNITKDKLQQILDDGNIVVYEYIDALSEDLCTGKEDVMERHLYAMKDERCIVICTASNLYEEVSKYRNKNLELITNGVQIEHFSKNFKKEDIPNDIKDIVDKNKPIIGYFGALAKWFDYELVEKLAKKHPEYEILLIGWDYDGSLQNSNISRIENITVIGPVDYQDLPKYAYWFTVSTIPFIINDITLATSPIKLFEYMALEHPIVTSDMPECRKYKSVDIGKDHKEFIEKVEIAITKSQCEETKKLLKSEALQNTWLEKSRRIDKLVKENILEL